MLTLLASLRPRANSTETDGILTALTIDQDDMIISGHRRWGVAQEIGLSSVPVMVREVYDPLDAERLLIESNRQREKTTSKIHREAGELERIIGAQAKARMVTGGRIGGELAGRGRPLPDAHRLPANWQEAYGDDDEPTPTPERGETAERVAALANGLALRGDWVGPLFVPVKKGGHLARRRMTEQAVYAVLAKRATIDRRPRWTISPHVLRRTYVSDLLNRGADIARVQKLAGHADMSTTARYDRRGGAVRRAAANLLHVPYGRRRG